ncbi:MAG: coproporphyrinogen-III oxidase family protein, partial [Anaerovoracaceae bacterium]
DALGRLNTGEEFFENFKMARRCGFDNINIDLMFGIPMQTPEGWASTLGAAFKLNPEHISFYSLQLEDGTPFYDRFKAGDLDVPPDADERVMYHYAYKALEEHGYEVYEISNAAKPGYESKHNLKYWDLSPYLGVGLGAYSFAFGSRFSNKWQLDEYIEDLNNEKLPIEDNRKNTLEDSIGDYMITALRRKEGVYFPEFARKFGLDFADVFYDQRHLIRDLIKAELLERDETRIKLTEKGIDHSNEILAEFLIEPDSLK